jgi:hypothetical protein
MHLRRDLLDDPFDVEEIDRPFRIAPERSDRAVEDDGDAMVLDYAGVGCRVSGVDRFCFDSRLATPDSLAVVRPSNFE